MTRSSSNVRSLTATSSGDDADDEHLGATPTSGGGGFLRFSARSPLSRRVTLFLECYALALITVGIISFFGTYSRTSEFYLSAANLHNIIGDQSVLIVVATASLFPLICGEFDFSVGATVTAAHVGLASATGDHHLSLGAGIAVALAIGLLVGLLNAFLVTIVGVSGIISTLGVGTLVVGLVSYYTHGAVIVSGIPRGLTDFGANLVLNVPTITICTLVVAATILYVLSSTPSGRYLYSVGSNRNAAHLVGLSVPKYIASSFVISGLMAGVAGVLLVARTGVGDPQAGNTPLTLQALSAAFLGATAIRPGRFNVIGTLIAVLFIAFSVSGLSLAGAQGWVSDVFTGTALIVAVAVSRYFARQRERAPRDE